MKERIYIKKSNRILAFTLMVVYIFVSCPFSLLAQNSDIIFWEKQDCKKEKINAKNGGYIELGDASIEIPEDALIEDTEISITHISKLADTGESLCNVIPDSKGYRFLPAGTKFEKDVVITLPYDPMLNEKPQLLDKLYTYFFDTEKQQWIKLERLEIDKDKCVVRSLTTHFTDMINATLTLPESASPVDVNLNSIKNLEAATPDTHLLKFNPPKASNMGDANFSFELGVPVGRNNLQPQISINYSSGGGNGIMGKGFDVSYGSNITTDTRLGLPNYDTKDTYLLDGILLKEISRKSDNSIIIYELEKETSFNRIIRYNAGQENDYWEVIDKTGTKRLYGQNNTACVGSENKIFTWNITKIEDIRSNNVIFEYIKDSGYVYPSRIYYTGIDEAKGNYNIQFHYDNDGFETRKDIRVDARSKEIVSCKKLLTTITTHYKDELAIRSYNFNYTEGLANEKMLLSIEVSNNADGRYEYSFDYKEVEKDNYGNIIYFAEPVEWENGQPLQTGSATSLGTSSNGSAGVGIGTKILDARATAGTSGSQTSGETYTEDTLIDINGDGRLDSVKQDGYNLFVALNTGTGFESEYRSISIEEGFKSDLEYETNSSSSTGWNTYVGTGAKISAISISAGAAYSEVEQSSDSYLTTSFIDMNRDGYVDIVESGKDYYLKNNGDLSFSKEKIYVASDIQVENVVEELSGEKIKEYQETYFVQTPFRMWKSPYEGIINIKSDAKSLDKNPESSVEVQTFFGNNEMDDVLSFQIPNICKKENIEIEEGEKIYFISNNGIEPRNTDIDWDIDINYSHIKILNTFKDTQLFLFNNFREFEIIEKNVNNNLSTIEQEFKTEFKNIYNELYFNFYKIEDLENQFKLTYNEDWQETLDQETKKAIFSQLLKDGLFYPKYYSSELFNKVCGNLLNTEEENKYRKFAQSFEYNATSDLYELKLDEDACFNFYEEYKNVFTHDIRKQALNLYTVEGMQTSFSTEGVVFSNETDLIKNGTYRSNNIVGSVYFDENYNNKLLMLGYYTDGDNNLLKLEYNFNTKQILENGNPSEKFFLSELTENEQEMIFTLLSDINENSEYEIKIVFSNKMDRAFNLSKLEMDKIVDSFELEYTNVLDSYWNWEANREVKTEDFENLFRDIKLTTEEKELFISYIYEKKGKYEIKIESILDEKGNQVLDENGKPQTEEKTVLVYEYYSIKDNPNYQLAQKILDEYKERIVLNELFYYYVFDNAKNEYIIKNDYMNANSNVDFLLEKCNEFNLEKYESVSYEISYNNEYLYDISDGNYTFLILEPDGKFKTSLRTLKSQWNSSEDFSNINRNINKYIGTIIVEEEIEEGKFEEVEEIIEVGTEEFLYGGINSWYYGIWKGNLNDNKFSEQKLEQFNDIINISNEEELTEEEKEKKIKEIEAKILKTPIQENQEEKIFFYLPQIKENYDYIGNDVNFRDASTDYYIDYTKALLGNVSKISKIEKSETGRKPIDYYYMPFICGNIIHVDRAGGDSYYNIEGLNIEKAPDVSNNNYLTLPIIRKTHTEGTDKTPSASINLETQTAQSITEVVNNETNIKEIIEEIKNFSFDANGSYGKNESTSNVKQSIQDINGDCIPDIVQVKNKGIEVTYGSLNLDGKLEYVSKENFSNINSLSESKSNINVKGGSVTPGGSISISTKGSKIMTSISPSANSSSGLTYSSGNTEQKKGLIDINGDGLNDYFDGNSCYLNIGKEFKLFENFLEISSISSTKNESVGLNFTLGAGGNLMLANSLNTGASANAGITYSYSASNTEKMMLDINGDGLQDIIEMDIGESIATVKYNSGNSFSAPQKIIIPSWGNVFEIKDFLFLKDNSFDLGLLNCIEIANWNLADSIADTSIYPFAFNSKKYVDSLDWNSSITYGGNGNLGFNLNLSFPIFWVRMNVTTAIGGGINASTSINGVSVKILDLDGDGLQDHVLRIPGDKTYWKRNISGTYGQLEQINLPQGGNIQLEYTEQYGTIDNPYFKYVMSKVIVNDGCCDSLEEISHGEHSITTKYEFKNGYYDRLKKEFLGFETVKTINSDGNYKIDKYYNRDYYSKGILKESTQYDSEHYILTKTCIAILEAPYALPIREESWIYERKTGNENFIYSSTEYEYDEYGNCVTIIQEYGDDEKLIGRIDYNNSDLENYIIGLPTEICVYDQQNNLLRKREGVYNDFGELIELRQYYNNYNYSSNFIEYDEYGNIKSLKDSSEATVLYEYDEIEKMFVTKIYQFGKNTDIYESSIEYMIDQQIKTKETDCNGNSIFYKYDGWQRPLEIRTSYDTGVIPSISYEYSSISNQLWYSITRNKILFDAEDDSVIETVVQIDGLGRVARTSKTGLVYRDGIKIVGWNTSGAVEYDEKGRIVKEGMPEFVTGTLEELLQTQPIMTSLCTNYEYDEKDRKTKIILPDGAIQLTEFYISDNTLITRTVDPLSNVSIQKTDSRGNIVEVCKENIKGKQLTSVKYEYNVMGEMLKAWDVAGNPITVEYDLLGRRISLESLDGGRQEFFYDENSNLIAENNSVLKENFKQIMYEYDGLHRLIKIDYPDTEDTVYVYGDAKQSNKAAGKIVSIKDASGTIEYEYGLLGEVIKETRTLHTHLNGIRPTETSIMEYRSDYLGRMQWIIYPDGEKIVYGYDEGGQVISVTGKNFGNIFNYVVDIGYDEYGQRVYIKYGNGVETTYTYNAARRWLNNIETHNKYNEQFQNIEYEFDLVGNVLSYTNDCITNMNGNYKTSQSYKYDDLYQLIRVDGETTYNPYASIDPEYISNYTQEFTFDELGLGNMTSKISSEKVSPHKTIGDNLNYNFTYSYDENYAHRLKNVGNRYYKYDSNGNIVIEQDGSFEENEENITYYEITEEAEDVYSTDYGWGLFNEEQSSNSVGITRYKRTYTWNERNQLISSVDANYSTAYIYGQDGQRSNKYTDLSETLYFNKMWTLHTDSGNSVYGGQYSKNIYLGETRIVTKLNSRNNPTYQEEYYKQYYYHSDHLGSASMVTDYKGDEYQRIEYSPYGEIWVEKTNNTGLEYLPYKFTAKELDDETGLYYYGARYLDPKYSMWLSTDPALGEYIPQAPINDEIRKNNQNLPGMGGIFNHINSNLYAYGANNPVKYTDPDGRFCVGYFYDPYFESYRYEIFTYREFSILDQIIYYGFYQGCGNFIPFGGYLTNYATSFQNWYMKKTEKKYEIIFNSDSQELNLSENLFDVFSTLVPSTKYNEIINTIGSYLAVSGTWEAISSFDKDKLISQFFNNQTSYLFSGITNKNDAIFVAQVYVKCAIDYYKFELDKKGVTEAEWGKTIKQYLWNEVKNDLFKSVYGE